MNDIDRMKNPNFILIMMDFAQSLARTLFQLFGPEEKPTPIETLTNTGRFDVIQTHSIEEDTLKRKLSKHDEPHEDGGAQ